MPLLISCTENIMGLPLRSVACVAMYSYVTSKEKYYL